MFEWPTVLTEWVNVGFIKSVWTRTHSRTQVSRHGNTPPHTHTHTLPFSLFSPNARNRCRRVYCVSASFEEGRDTRTNRRADTCALSGAIKVIAHRLFYLSITEAAEKALVCEVVRPGAQGRACAQSVAGFFPAILCVRVGLGGWRGRSGSCGGWLIDAPVPPLTRSVARTLVCSLAYAHVRTFGERLVYFHGLCVGTYALRHQTSTLCGAAVAILWEVWMCMPCSYKAPI